MTNITARPLPTDFASLKVYLPSEPDGTEVVRYRRAVGRLDQAIAVVTSELERLDRQDRDLAAALVDLASAEGPMDCSGIGLGDRPSIEHRLAVLRQARSTAYHQLTSAEHSDPPYLAWKAECKAITAEWQQTQAAESPEARFAAVVAFAERH